MIKTLNLADAFEAIQDCWKPTIAFELNGQEVRLAKLKGRFVWHRHEDADELFYVVQGSLTIKLRDGDIVLKEGDLTVVPRGVEHCPETDEEAWVLLFEPTGTLNTGNVRCERTIEELERL